MAENAGRIPPNDKAAETAVLGAVLLRNKVLEDIYSLITADDFYVRANANIWKGIVAMRNEMPGVTIDLVSLTTFLTTKGTLADRGGPSYIASLTSTVPATRNATYFAQIIKNMSLKRQLLELSVQVSDSAFDETQDIKASIDQIDQKLSALSTNSSTMAYLPSGMFLQDLLTDIEAIEAGTKSPGLSTGFETLDSYIGGFKPGELTIIGARPSVGKTAFALSIAHNMAFKSSGAVKVGFFSLEMSGSALMERLLSRESSINSMDLRRDKSIKENKQQILDAIERMYDYAGNLLIQDTPNIKLMEIRSQSRRMVHNDGVKIIFVDYIGLIELDSSSAKPRHEQISEISRALKSLARELQVPVVCLSQVNREAGKDRPPILADLRESGSIEQDADIVMLLDDPSKRLDENNKIEQYNEEDGIDRSVKPIKIIIAKQRNGKVGAFNMNFRSNYVSFVEIEKRPGL